MINFFMAEEVLKFEDLIQKEILCWERLWRTMMMFSHMQSAVYTHAVPLNLIHSGDEKTFQLDLMAMPACIK